MGFDDIDDIKENIYQKVYKALTEHGVNAGMVCSTLPENYGKIVGFSFPTKNRRSFLINYNINSYPFNENVYITHCICSCGRNVFIRDNGSHSVVKVIDVLIDFYESVNKNTKYKCETIVIKK